MRQSTRLIVNMMAICGRMGITFAMSLVSTRIILGALGEVDYGLLTVLGASGLLISLITIALTESSQRHLAFQIGRGDEHMLRVVFNSTLGLFLIAGVALWAIGAALAPLILRVLDIPPDREQAAFWVYHITLLTVVTTSWSTPFRGTAQARQALVYLSGFEVATAVNRLLAAMALLLLSGDLLVQFMLLILAGRTVIAIVLVTSCMVRFPESVPRPRLFCWSQLRNVSGVAGWMLVQRSGGVLRLQGGIMLINVFFGPVVNSAYAIAVQVANYQAKLIFTISQVVLPAMTTAAGRGNRQQVRILCLLVSKYTVLACLCVAVPLMLEADPLVRLWLKEPPGGTVLFLQLILVWLTIPLITRGHNMAVMAVGDMARYVSITTSLNLSALVLSVFWFWVFDFPPWALPVSSIVASIVITWYRLVAVGRMIDLPISEWVRRTLVPTLLAAAPASALAYGIHVTMADSLLRALAVVFVYGLAAVPIGWLVLESTEKEHFRRVAAGVLTRLKLHTAGN